MPVKTKACSFSWITFLVALCGSSAALAAPPYPILFVHGIFADDTTWDGTIHELALRYGFAPDDSLTLHACLNYDGNPTRNNLTVRRLSFPTPPQASDDADIALYFPPEAAGTRHAVYRLNFKVSPNFAPGPDGSPRNGDSVLYPSAVAAGSGSPHTQIAVTLGSARTGLHIGQFLRWTDPINTANSFFYQIKDFSPPSPYDTTLSIPAGAPDPSFRFELVGLSNQESILKQAVALSAAVQEVLARTGAPKVILVTHSMGGLAARTYLQWGRTSQQSIGTLWAEAVPGGHHVAKLVTLGTPHLGSNAASEGFVSLVGIDPRSNASRDLAYDYGNNGSYAPNAVPTGALPGILLLGGAEAGIPSGLYYSQDVDDNGQASSLSGLDFLGSPNYNTAKPLPLDIDYSWLVGMWLDTGDLCVRSDRQYLANMGNTELIHACHSSPLCACVELAAIDPMLEALDEPNSRDLAYDLALGGSLTGFISCRQDAGTWSCQDDDVYRLIVSAPGILAIDIAGGAGVSSLTLLDSSGQPIPGATVSVTGGAGATLTYTAAVAGTYYARVRGTGVPSQTGIDSSGSILSTYPCGTSSIATPYTLSALLESTSVSLSASPQTLTVGQQTTLLAAVRYPSGAPAGAGISVTFSANSSGIYGGCTVAGSGCRAVTNGSGVAQVTFSPTGAGVVTITAQAETGGTAQTPVSAQPRGGSASASPNPVAVNLPSTITVTYQPAPPSGTPVTFSSGYPGVFTGGSSSYSPSTTVTNAGGTATIQFASSSVGTASINIDSGNAATQVVALQIVNPNASVNLQLNVSYVSGDATSSTYRIEALVTNSSGQPVSGQRVEFTASSGSFCPPSACSTAHDFTATTGIGRANLTIVAAGTVTVTAVVNSSSAATTFVAQIGSSASGPMTPVHTFSMSSGSQVFGLAFSPDGSALIASGYGSSMITAWNTSDWSQRWSVAGRHNKLGEVSISSDGSQVLTASDRGAEIHSLTDGAWICDSSLTSAATMLATFAGGSQIFAASPSSTYRASACGSLLANTAGSFEREGHFDYNSISRYITGGDADGNVDFWDAVTGASVKSISILTAGSAYDARWSASGARVLAVGKAGTVALLNTSGNPSSWSKSYCTVTAMPGWRITAASWLDNDTKVAVGGDNNGGPGRIEVLDAFTCSSLRYATTDSRVLELAWNPSTQELAAGTNSGTVYVLKPLVPPDTINPTISVTAPADNAVTNLASLVTTGRVTDNTSVSSFTINGSATALDGSGNFSASVSLAEGTNTISYHAVDPSGNAADVTRTVTRVVDRVPPVITGVSVAPASGPPGTSFSISCSITDADTGVASATATVRNGTGGAVRTLLLLHGTGSSYGAAFDSSGTTVGGYSVDITAVDSSPQTNSRVLTGAAAFIVTPVPVPPAPPSGLQATGSNGHVDLLWIDNAANETGFKVERQTGAAGAWTDLATLPADTVTYQDSGVACGTAYAYRVRAFNEAGDSARSNEAAVTPQCSCTPSLNPTGAVVEPLGGAVSFTVNGCGSWTAASSMSWITVTGGATGTGIGVVSIQVAKNAGAARTGAVNVAGLSFTVDQAAAPADPGYSSSLRLLGGALAGQTVDAVHRTVKVTPGAHLTGSISYQIDSTFSSNAAMAAGITLSWGSNAASYADLGGFATPVTGLVRSVDISATAPLTPGTYHILLAFRGEFTAGQVMSATNWAVGTLVWDNGDDIADWPQTMIDTANREGTVLANYLGTGGNTPTWVPATAITVVVTEGPLDFYTILPCRVFDSRAGGGQPLASGGTYSVVVAGRCNIPASAQGVAANVTITQPTAQGYVTFWPSNLPRPLTSVLNFTTGQTLANNAVLLLSTDGLGMIGVAPFLGANGTVHLVIDVTGYFQ
jgi:pimeloyl-ACP methyl ester carboxylesterase